MEMLETATILREATSRSLVIMDEIGRGTSTADGLALAWACAKHMHDVIGARTLFATHYHELAAMASQLANVACCKADLLIDKDGGLVFLFKITAGAADRSYGIQVARLAGVPEEVLREARATLDMLEAQAPPSAVARS